MTKLKIPRKGKVIDILLMIIFFISVALSIFFILRGAGYFG